MKFFAYTVIVIVAAAIIAGFFIVGSPGQERLRRFDERKINELNVIQSQIISFWQSKKRVPQTLSELNNDISGFRVPTDPQSGDPYGYTVLGPLSFELCAVFNAESRDIEYPVSAVEPREPYLTKPLYENLSNWEHGPGQQCFERTIDPDIYKLPPKD